MLQGNESRDGATVPRNDGRVALFSSLQKAGHLIPRFFSAFPRDSTHGD